MKTHDNMTQGDAAWHAHRAQHFNASDAPAMLGCSPFKTRDHLLREKKTGIIPEADAATQRRFDIGHSSEARARPLAESIIGDDLAAIIGSEGELSASFDGLTLMHEVAFEHKALNYELLSVLDSDDPAGNMPKHYRVQMEQQCLVSGCEKVLFMASKWDGDTLVEERHYWYRPNPALRAEIVAGWKQFAADLAAYVPTEVKEMPKAEVTLALPALFIHAKGEITTSNMKEYGVALAGRLAEVRAIALVTDQDFSNAKESAKLLRENIQQAKLAKDAMLAQTVTVGEAARMIDNWCEDMRLTALKLEQDVEREDKAKKVVMLAAAKSLYEAHIDALKVDTGGPWIVLPAPDWASAIKNKRSFASMQDALDTMLANAKIAADESARKIRASLACMAEESKGYEFLLADRLAHIGKPVEDVRMLVRARITEHKAAEEKREAETRARIRAEEQARAARDLREAQEVEDGLIVSIWRSARRIEHDSVPYIKKAMAAFESGAKDWENDPRARVAAAVAEARIELAGKLEAAQARENLAAEQAETARQAAAATPAAPAPAPAPIAAPAPAPVAANVVQMQRATPPADDGKRINLSDIKDRIHPMQITADGLAELGFKPAAIEKGAKLYRAADFPLICEALMAVLTRARDTAPMAA